MTRIISAIALAVAALVGAATASQAALFQNGSFEIGPAPGEFTTLTAGSTAITGWTVTGTSIDYIGSYWQPQEGSRSLDLSGTGAETQPGGIQQTFDTTTGLSYVVGFWVSGNPDGGPSEKEAFVEAAAGSTTATFDTAVAGNTRTDMMWSFRSFLFTALAPATTLSFTGITGTQYGLALDNVTVSAVPIPAALPLFAGGLGLLGYFSSRRRKRAALRCAQSS